MNLTAQQTRVLTWLLVLAPTAWLAWQLSPVLTPFVVAAVLAYALQPAVEALARFRVPRTVAVLVVELVFVMAVLAIALLIVPILSKNLPLLRDQIPVFAESANKFLSPKLQELGFNVALDTANIKAFVLKYLDANFEEWLATALNSARIGGSFAITIIGNAVLMPVVLFYLLYEWPILSQRIWGLVPPRVKPKAASFLTECDAMLGQYLRGQLLVMLALATFYSVALSLARFNLALPVGVFTGLAVCIPYLGFGLGLLLALLAGLLQFQGVYGVVAVAVIYGIGQLLESFVLTPRLVGERIGLNPLAVIFALLAFGHLFGFIGVLIALPVSALVVVALRRARNFYLQSRLFQDS